MHRGRSLEGCRESWGRLGQGAGGKGSCSPTHRQEAVWTMSQLLPQQLWVDDDSCYTTGDRREAALGRGPLGAKGWGQASIKGDCVWAGEEAARPGQAPSPRGIGGTRVPGFDKL